jgi:hypothetical protein
VELEWGFPKASRLPPNIFKCSGEDEKCLWLYKYCIGSVAKVVWLLTCKLVAREASGTDFGVSKGISPYKDKIRFLSITEKVFIGSLICIAFHVML